MNNLLAQNVEPADPLVAINIGALFDVPTGEWWTGLHGEWILNGGLNTFTGVVGIGNNFKTTVMKYMTLTGCARMVVENYKGQGRFASTGQTYDTEVNAKDERIAHLAAMIPDFMGEDIIDSGRWILTNKAKIGGTAWYETYREFTENKVKLGDKIAVKTPFWNRNRTAALEILMPTFREVDSFTEFETDDVEAMQDKNVLGDSGGNTIHMRQGLGKLRFLMSTPARTARARDYLVMTAHLGKETTMQNAGPGGQVPIVKNVHLKNGDKIKGTTDKFLFLTTNCWNCAGAKPLMAKDLDGPEYPRDADDKLRMDTDLMIVQVKQLRGKSGPSGMGMALLVSQADGVLPSLTEFHHIKEYDRYGLEGSNTSYALVIYPECKISRTTVRGKLDEDARLRRAMNITSELCQMSYLMHGLEDDLICDPKVLYEDLKARGYDWNELLDTRGWWSPDPDHPVPFLSTMDLLKMRKGEYHPYWMEPKNEQQKAARDWLQAKIKADTEEIHLKRGIKK